MTAFFSYLGLFPSSLDEPIFVQFRGGENGFFSSFSSHFGGGGKSKKYLAGTQPSRMSKTRPMPALSALRLFFFGAFLNAKIFLPAL